MKEEQSPETLLREQLQQKETQSVHVPQQLSLNLNRWGIGEKEGGAEGVQTSHLALHPAISSQGALIL